MGKIVDVGADTRTWLKECPGQENKDYIHELDIVGDNIGSVFFVLCSCGWAGPKMRTPMSAVVSWNDGRTSVRDGTLTWDKKYPSLGHLIAGLLDRVDTLEKNHTILVEALRGTFRFMDGNK